jgi:hypothetical protein
MRAQGHLKPALILTGGTTPEGKKDAEVGVVLCQSKINFMQTFKIENYEQEHGLGTFVSFRHLTDGETNIMKEDLRKCLKLRKDISPSDMVQTIYNRSIPVDGVNAEDEAFDLSKLLYQLEFGLSEITYLNWHHYDDVDALQTKDILTTFHDIWYPSADDLDLVDSNMQWVLCIHHSGTVRALSLGTRYEPGTRVTE